MSDRSTPTPPPPPRGRRLLRGALCAVLAVASLVALPITTASAIPNCPRTNPDYPDCGPGGPTEPPPPAAGSVSIGALTTSSIATTTNVPAGVTAWYLQQFVPGPNTWTTVASGSSSGSFSRVDAGIPPDTQRCWRVITANANGSTTSGNNCAYTHDARVLASVYRVQLQLTTGNVSGAGTSDEIYATVSGPKSGILDTTFIQPARHSDLSQGDTHTYDLVALNGIHDFSDIEAIVLGKSGTDDWCVSAATLLVNNVPVFSSSLGDPCTWITENGGGHPSVGINHDMLRSDPQWAAWQYQLPPITNNPDGTATLTLQIPKDELAARVEANISQALHGEDAVWDLDHAGPVTLTPYLDNRIKVDVGLIAHTPWYLPDPTVDLPFQLVASTAKDPTTGVWNLNINVDNAFPDVNFPWWADLLDVILPCGPIASIATGTGIPFCLPAVGDIITGKIDAALGSASSTMGISAAPSNLSATFDSAGNLNIVATLGTPKRVIHLPVGPIRPVAAFPAAPSTTAPPVATPVPPRTAVALRAF